MVEAVLRQELLEDKVIMQQLEVLRLILVKLGLFMVVMKVETEHKVVVIRQVAELVQMPMVLNLMVELVNK